MAKKSFNISSTLKKNKEVLDPKLPEKVVLKKKPRNFDEIKEKVEDIHQEQKKEPRPAPDTKANEETREIELPVERKTTPEPVKSVEVPQTSAVVPVTKSKRKSSNTVKERMVRMTIDTPVDMHRKLKIRSIEKGVSMRDYILRLIEREIKKG